jgi:cellobiose-specific phosphotransferase system component IIA
VEREVDDNKEGALLAGAGFGYAAGKYAGGAKMPTSAKYDAALERLQVARDKLNEVQSRVGSGSSLTDLEAEFKRAQGAYQAAEMELAKATDEMKSARSARTAPISTPEPDGLIPTADQQTRGIQGTTKDTGITGRASQTTYNERTSQIARNERAQRAALGKLGQQGIIDPNKAYALTEGISASTPSGLLVSPTEAQVQKAKLEAELAPMDERTQQARANRQAAGEARRTANQALKEARTAQGQVQRAESGVNVAQKAVERAGEAKPGVFGQVGAATAKVAPKALGVISGAATGMAAADAIEKFKQGDYSGAVLPTLEATFGVMSMLPPTHPILLALRGIGTVGGLGLAGYEGYKAVRGQPKE